MIQCLTAWIGVIEAALDLGWVSFCGEELGEVFCIMKIKISLVSSLKQTYR